MSELPLAWLLNPRIQLTIFISEESSVESGYNTRMYLRNSLACTVRLSAFSSEYSQERIAPMWIVRIKVLFKNLVKTAVLLTVLYSFFRYIGDFSLGQSIALTAISWVGYELFLYLKGRQVQNVFSPYTVTIFPNWYRLLLDFKLIHSAEEYDKLYTACKAKSENILHRGYWFTVVQPPNENGLPPGLIFWNNRNIFLSELDFCESILAIERSMPMGAKERHPFLDHPAYSGTPEFYINGGHGGYEFGLRVQYEWWE